MSPVDGIEGVPGYMPTIGFASFPASAIHAESLCKASVQLIARVPTENVGCPCPTQPLPSRHPGNLNQQRPKAHMPLPKRVWCRAACSPGSSNCITRHVYRLHHISLSKRRVGQLVCTESSSPLVGCQPMTGGACARWHCKRVMHSAGH